MYNKKPRGDNQELSRSEIRRNFSQLPDAILVLSHSAQAVYHYIVSKPDTWVFYSSVMLRELQIKRSETLAKYTNELQATGWITKYKLPNGLVEYTAYATPRIPVVESVPEVPPTPSKSTVPSKGPRILEVYNAFREIVLLHNKLFTTKAIVPKEITRVKDMSKSNIERLRWYVSNYTPEDQIELLTTLKTSTKNGASDNENAVKFLSINTIFRNHKNVANVLQFAITSPKKKKGSNVAVGNSYAAEGLALINMIGNQQQQET